MATVTNIRYGGDGVDGGDGDDGGGGGDKLPSQLVPAAPRR